MGFREAPPKVPDSEVISKFTGPQGIAALFSDFDELARNTESTRADVTQPRFLEIFAAFKNEPIPKGFQSAEREQAKKDLVVALESLIEGVMKKVSDQEIRKLAEPVRPAFEAFMRPTNY